MPTNNGKDHAEIKKQIKSWEFKIDEALRQHYKGNWSEEDILDTLEELSQEMGAINI